MAFSTIVNNEQKIDTLTDNIEISYSTRHIFPKDYTQYYFSYINMHTKGCFVQAYLQLILSIKGKGGTHKFRISNTTG